MNYREFWGDMGELYNPEGTLPEKVLFYPCVLIVLVSSSFIDLFNTSPRTKEEIAPSLLERETLT